MRVAVVGAGGRMGAEVCRAVTAAADLELVAQLDVGDSLQQLVDSEAQVVVDFTVPDAVMPTLAFCIAHGIHTVVGTSGFDEAKFAVLRRQLADAPTTGCLVAANFGIGAVLMMKVRGGRGALLRVRGDCRTASSEQDRRPQRDCRRHGSANCSCPPGGRCAAGPRRDHDSPSRRARR